MIQAADAVTPAEGLLICESELEGNVHPAGNYGSAISWG